jgi:hypothetical protein
MKLPRPARALVAASIAGGIATLVVASLRQPARVPVGQSQWIVAGAVGAALLASWLWPLVVFRGGESEAAHVDECFFVMLALLVPPVLALGTFAAAITLAQAIRRRPVVKSAFNAGQVLVAAGLGLVVSRGIAVPSGSLAVAQIAAVTAGVAVFQVVNTALVGGVMAAMGMTLQEFASDLRIQLGLAGGGALAGIVFAMAVRAHIWAISLAIPGLIVGRWLIGARYAALYDRARMEGLYEVTLKAHLQLRQQTVLDTILGSVRGLLRSPQATLTPAEPAPADLSAVMTVAGRRHWLVAAGGVGGGGGAPPATSPSTTPITACSGHSPPWARARCATPSSISRFISNANVSPRSRSISQRASARSTPAGASRSPTPPLPT